MTALSYTSTACNFSQTVLKTIMIPLKAKWRPIINCRALFDGGSQLTIMTENIVQKQGLKNRDSNCISGKGDTRSMVSKFSVMFAVPVNDRIVRVQAQFMAKLARERPGLPIETGNLKHLKHLRMADPKINVPRKNDLVVGNVRVHNFTLSGKLQENDNLFLLETAFGWVCSGKTEQKKRI